MTQKTTQQQSSSMFKWINRQVYKDQQLQKSVDKLTHKLNPEEQVSTVLECFQKIMRRSQLGLVYFNQQTKTIELHNIGNNNIAAGINSNNISFSKTYSDSKSKYNQGMTFIKHFNGEGSVIRYDIYQKKHNYTYGFAFTKFFNQRLDNHFCTTKDRISFNFSAILNNKYMGNLIFQLARQNRQNYLSFYNKDIINQNIFGLEQNQKNRLKQSKLWYIKCQYDYSILKTFMKFGFDYGNQSFFSEISLSILKYIDIHKNIGVNIKLHANQIFGKNILKNDYLFKNKKEWSARTTNFYTQKVQVLFKDFPYLSYFNVKPYIYCLTRHHFGGFGGKSILYNELDYGLGLSLREDSQIDMSLFKMSAQRQGGVFGTIKFEF